MRPIVATASLRRSRREGRGPTAAPSARRRSAARPASSARELVGLALEHRPDERAHHVAQERVGRDLELESVAAVVPARVSTMRTKTSCCVSVGVKARKSCSPSSSAAAAFSAARSSGRGCQSERWTSNGERSRRRQIAVAVRARARREARVEVGRRLLGRDDGDVVGQHGVQRLGGALDGGGPPSTSTETTFASACTPVSVRPATASSSRRRVDLLERAAHARPRRCARRAGAPSRGSRCRRTRASASGARQATPDAALCKAFLML